jgi:hypothetical protein
MQDRPTRAELLAAVRRFLEEDILPATSGRLQFLARVSAHALTLVEREMAHEERHAAREWQGLDVVLAPAEKPSGLDELRDALQRRNRDLCDRIREGAFDAIGTARDRLISHLRETVREKLEVADPGLLQRDDALRRPTASR